MGPGGGPGRHGYQKPKNLRGTLGKLMRYLGRYKAALCLVAVLLIISSVCTVGGSYLIKPLINDYILPGDFPGLAKMLAFHGLRVCGGRCVLLRLRPHHGPRVPEHRGHASAPTSSTGCRQLPLKYFDTHTHGELMSRYTNDIETISEALNNSFGSLISCSLNFAGTIIMMLVLSPLLTLITFGMLVVMLLVVKVIGSRSRRYFAGQQAAIGAVNGYIEEMIEGQKVIKVFNHEAAAKEGFCQLNEDYRQAATRAQAYAGAMMPAMGNLSYINYAITCCVGAMLAIGGGSFQLGDLACLFAVHPAGQPAHHPDLPAGEHHPGRCGRRRAGVRRDGSPAGDRRWQGHAGPHPAAEGRLPGGNNGGHRRLGLEKARWHSGPRPGRCAL